MNKKISKYLTATSFSLIIAVLAIMPSLVLAYSAPELSQWSNFTVKEFLQRAVDLLFSWVAPICVLMIIFGGVVFMTAGDDEGKTKMGKNFVKFALIGLAIVLAAGMLMSFVAGIGNNSGN